MIDRSQLVAALALLQNCIRSPDETRTSEKEQQLKVQVAFTLETIMNMLKIDQTVSMTR